MSKKLTELIAQVEMQKPQQGTGNKNRSAFLARKRQSFIGYNIILQNTYHHI
jgi:hypothetical protein